MGFIDILGALGLLKQPKQDVQAYNSAYSYNNVWSISVFDGEKNPGEIGNPQRILMDHESLRMRSWESYAKSEITQMIVGKHISWIVASGLKLQLEPAKLVLKHFGITIENEKEYSRLIEEYFSLYSKSKSSSYSNISNLHLEIREALKNAIVGGDVLCVFHIKNKRPKMQLIDGEHVKNPYFDNSFQSEAIARGNIIVDGIEINKNTKEHIAFFVQNSDNTFTRIPAKGARTGRTNAVLFTGFKYRIDDQRGIPLLAAVLQTLKVLDRYKEATVSAAEERAKIAFAIEHGSTSTGENPLTNKIKASLGQEVSSGSDPINNEKLAKHISRTTQKTAFNLPVDSKLVKLSDDADLHFADFFSSNIDLIAATMQTPPAVATSKYDTSYSASRAALKDWEHVIKIRRDDISFFIYKPFFQIWFQMAVLTNDLDIPDFLKALLEKNETIIEAYLNSRFIGPNIPHIDPLKEVKAERAKLGDTGKDIPLTTAEKSTEALNEGDYWSNIDKYKEELESVSDLATENNGE